MQTRESQQPSHSAVGAVTLFPHTLPSCGLSVKRKGTHQGSFGERRVRDLMKAHGLDLQKMRTRMAAQISTEDPAAESWRQTIRTPALFAVRARSIGRLELAGIVWSVPHVLSECACFSTPQSVSPASVCSPLQSSPLQSVFSKSLQSALAPCCLIPAPPSSTMTRLRTRAWRR